MSKLRLLVTGGGTGGHIYPIVSVVAELQILSQKLGIDTEVKYFGVSGDYRNLLEENGIEVEPIIGGKWRRYFSLTNFIDGPKFILGLLQSIWKIFWFMPKVVFSKGGPGALSVVMAARFYRIPVVIHESDAFPGMTNSISSRFAKVITIAFPAAANYFRGEVIVTGNPVRRYLFGEKLTMKTGKGVLEFDTELPLLLVLGGSQGSKRINEFVVKNLTKLLEITQVFHQTGKNNYSLVLNEAGKVLQTLPINLQKRYKAVDYLEKDLSLVMQACDLVLSRAGAGSIFEIAAFGKPSILIPLPESANNHQLMNATDYAATGAAIVFEEENLRAELFFEQLINLLNHPDKLEKMSRAATKFSHPEAASNIAKIILKLGGYGS